MKRLLLHTCCAPCAIYVIKKLTKEFSVSIFFYDPNIHPRREYNQRRDEMRGYAQKIGLDFQEGEYDSIRWLTATQGLENEPERGRRCDVCFDLRLAKTASQAKAEQYDVWATVLTISPHKDAERINAIGNRLAGQYGITFLDGDWKKQDGFKTASRFSRAENFYRQDYCGCLYSKAEKERVKHDRLKIYADKII
ncbi:MAG: recombinase [Parcubacteria group bacterium]|nr:MAG: recombinase [Parcubacteria group bacterium]